MFPLSPAAYLWVKALHIIAAIAWMAALLYLPRLFVYHADATPGSELALTLQTMERRLLRAIMTPAMIATLALGLVLLAHLGPGVWGQPWWWGKLASLFGLLALHGLLARWRRELEAGQNRHSAKFYRVINEIPTVLMIAVIIFVVLKPFA